MSAQLVRDRRRLRAVVVVCAVLSFYMWRFVMYSDGISYLEIADRYKAGAWREAVNPYWSPLYSWILAVALLPLRHGSYNEVIVVHLVNLVALLVSFVTFELLLKELALSGRLALIVAYALFLWGAVGLIGCGATMPDLIVTIWVYLLTTLVIRFRKSEPGLGAKLGFGAIAALAYFTKTAMLVIGGIYIVTAAMAARRTRVAVITALAWLLLTSPWLWALHEVAGKWTIGESGRLNYAWEVQGVRRSTHWQGDGALHPTRRLSTAPPVFEYAEPIGGTYPPWLDPSYWYAGLRTPPTVGPELRAMARNGGHVALLFLLTPGLVVGLLLARWTRLRAPGVLLAVIPALASIMIYSLVFIEPRYVSAQLVIVGLAVVGSWSDRPLARWQRRLLGGNAFVGCAWFLKWVPAAGILLTWQIVGGGERFTNPHWRMAQEMRALGMHSGDQIAYVGLPITAYWARLAGVRIIAEVPTGYDRVGLASRLRFDHSDTDVFWRSDRSEQQRVLDIFVRTGARWVVADVVPPWADMTGWNKLTTLQHIEGEVSAEMYARRLDGERRDR